MPKLFVLSSIAVALVASTTSFAFAQGRPDTTRMSCAAAQALVVRAGAIVMSTGGSTYDRLVRHRGYCTPSERTEVVFAPTADNPACYIGDRCVEKTNEIEP